MLKTKIMRFFIVFSNFKLTSTAPAKPLKTLACLSISHKDTTELLLKKALFDDFQSRIGVV